MTYARASCLHKLEITTNPLNILLFNLRNGLDVLLLVIFICIGIVFYTQTIIMGSS